MESPWSCTGYPGPLWTWTWSSTLPSRILSSPGLEAGGYRTLHRSGGYSNHSHPEAARGDLDFVYVQGETADKLFASCRKAQGPGGREAPVPSPEHLAALKVFSLKNDPDRAFRDQEDLRFLLHLPGVDQGKIRSYFERHGLGERFQEIL